MSSRTFVIFSEIFARLERREFWFKEIGICKVIRNLCEIHAVPVVKFGGATLQEIREGLNAIMIPLE